MTCWSTIRSLNRRRVRTSLRSLLLVAGMYGAMQTVTFIHTSDLQIGMTRKFLSPEAQSRFDDARLRSITRLGDLAQVHGAAFIVVAGDVFEHNALEPATLGRALEALRQVPVPVYLLPGNHDPLVADSVFVRARDLANVTVLDSSEPVEVCRGVEIVAAPLLAKQASEDLCARAIRGLEPTERIRILVGHGQVEGYGAEDTSALIDLHRLEEALDTGVVDYVALGDTHSTMALGDSGRVWFSGSPETTDFHDRTQGGGEVDSGNALVVTLRKQGFNAQVELSKKPVGVWRFEALSWEVTDADDVERIVDQLAEYPNKDRTVIKYSITGTLGVAAMARLETALAELEPVFAALYPRQRLMQLHLDPSTDELENLPLTGYARAAMRELVVAASGEGSAQAADPVARDAVNLLFRLAQKV